MEAVTDFKGAIGCRDPGPRRPFVLGARVSGPDGFGGEIVEVVSDWTVKIRRPDNSLIYSTTSDLKEIK